MAGPDPALTAFAEELGQELLYEADVEGAEAMLPEVFTRRVIETLTEAGELEEALDCHHSDESARPRIDVSGYGIDDGDTLNLIATVYRGIVPPSTITKTDIATAFRRLRAFWERCRDNAYHESLEESSDAWDMALQVHRCASSIRRVRLFVATDGIGRLEYLEPETIDGVEYCQSIWDLTRLWRLNAAGRRGEPIEIDFVARYGQALPALAAPGQENEYRAYLAIFPGDVLADIYDQYGARLLERNVRSFLQFTGKVNKGMRSTIADEPGRFLAYNNGISATAAEVTLTALPDGGTGISRIRDLQIVNGGQTTASIHRSTRGAADVRRVAVQAKITEVDGELLDELVPRISEYANSQNKVQLADLSSNDPFHIELESLSRNIWAPAHADTPRQTKWFYERARGQYSDAMNRELTRARQRMFKEAHPPRQRFAKVELATFENTWNLFPHEVSKGAQKNFAAFMLELGRRRSGFRPDAAYFQRAVAKAILFRRAERIVSAQNFGGYRRNIVTYSIAKLSYATQQRLDLGRIWASQDVDPAIEHAIEELAHLAFVVLTASDRPAQNVTEWAKRDECWKRMRELNWKVPVDIQSLLVPIGPGTAASDGTSDGRSSPMDGALAEHDPLVQELASLDGETLLAIANWAKQTDNLSPWDRRFAYTAGVHINRGKSLTPKQAPHAKRILEEARARGFTA